MNLTLDKAAYRPGEQAVCAVWGIPARAALARLALLHLQETVFARTEPVTGDAATFTVELPPMDFTGYLLRLDALDARGATLATAYIAADCSSRWTRFPRYGYVWDFTAGAAVEEKVAQLTRYHLNGLQFYDWQYRHHMPVAPDTSGWADWTGRAVDGGVLRRYLNAAHARNMACMAYNMIYAANRTYLTDGSGVDAAWRLVKESGADFTCEMDAALGDVGVAAIHEPAEPGVAAVHLRAGARGVRGV